MDRDLFVDDGFVKKGFYPTDHPAREGQYGPKPAPGPEPDEILYGGGEALYCDLA